jgi:hypothetical protein
MVIVVMLFFLHKGITHFYNPLWFRLSLATLFFLAFTWFIAQIERKELRKLPLVGRLL